MTAHVVVVGGGFAGVACARRLARDGNDDVRVTLIDKNGYHQFQPLLYQVATAELARRDMSFDLAAIFDGDDAVQVRTGEVTDVDLETRTVTLAGGGTVTGDVLVMAAGAAPNFFHTPGAAEHAYPLYSVDNAERIRETVLRLFAEAAAKPELIAEGALTFVVVGAGPTGVETAGALAELVHDVMPHVHDTLVAGAAKVILVDLGHTVLPAFSDEAHDYAAKQLRHRGVELRLGQAVREIGPGHVTLGDGTTIKTQLVVWGGGISAAPLAARCGGLTRGRGGRIDVAADLTVSGFPGVYAVGDVANIPFGDEPALPQLGSVAAQSGAWAARNILADLRGGQGGGQRESFHYRDKGIMAMIGRRAAVAEIGPHRHELHGRMAFAAWLGVHAQLLANARAEVGALDAWAEDFYLRPHHRSAHLLDPEAAGTPRINWNG
ncbi:NAD(P)/FAD-dependent oxidoreductase [Actinomadura barringtoniae]|uniref:NADH:ubiquinone reductase (non-electrogenic) n=1 Tax=Actinomadura barringtoniae TaxID=1427535 RepID=A0A939PPZ9_9ACTN|nr:NAD(P)/FAD-dependent oxidoreductase [Actinomadura barringtoniae]MBO2453079.1 NAD(P)/FAD-dependent oxidoreductase [Actinomadura barringtoniae]